MSTKDRLIRMCFECGMFENDAKQVVESAIPDIDALVSDYQITWDQPADGYPNQLYAIWFITVKEHAIKWIDKNCPQAWFREVFAN